MKMNDVRKKASELGVKSIKRGKSELIRAIQTAEGNFPCFGTAAGDCDQHGCCWRKDCLAQTA